MRAIGARERYRGALLGLAAGDAVGTAAEFAAPGSFDALSDMVGGGPFGLQPGEWTDDTSMALCLATSLVSCRGFDARDQMERYLRWMRTGYLSSNGRCFDVGNTVRAALRRFEESGEPFAGSTRPDSAGNGSLMRLAPVVLYYHPDRERAIHHAAESSRTTHGAAECLDACRLFAGLLLRALSGDGKREILAPFPLVTESARLRNLAAAPGALPAYGALRGTGYVVDSLEAALACFAAADSYREAVLAAANLGDDADTTAAICGQLAGACFGAGGIPEEWLGKLALRREIETLADALLEGPAS